MFDLPDGWKWQAFSEILAIPLRNGIYKKKEFHGRGSKIINMGELFGFPRLRGDVEMKRVELSDKDLINATLKNGDLIFARRSLTAEGAGKCSIVLSLDEPTTFESSIIRARLNQKIATPEYYYYLFNSPFGKWLLQTILRQVAVSGITGSDLAKLNVPVPPKQDQDNLVEILRSIDDKIDINAKINQSLERLVNAIFKSWFIDFEPTRAKIAALQNGDDPELAAMAAVSGKSIEAIETLNAEQLVKLKNTAALFPDSLVETEFGQIPKDWHYSEIGKEVTVVGGGTPSTKQEEFWKDGHINWTSPKDMSNLTDKILLNTERKITEAGLAKISSGLLPANTVLMSSRAPVGYLAISKIPVAVNQGYIAMKCTGRLTPEFTVQWAHSIMDDIKQRASGTTFAEISKKNFKIIPVLVPDERIINAYTQTASALYDKITENIRESKHLQEIRDSLLPRLLSGEINVGG